MERDPSRPQLHASADRGDLPTESRLTASAHLDAADTGETLALINEQDALVAEAVRQAIPSISRLVDAVVAAFQRGGRLIYLGAGTSGRLGVLDASECPPTFFTEPGMVVGIIAGGDVALRRSVEGAEDNPDGARADLEALNVGPADVVVGIAAGGTTPYVWGALRVASERGAVTGMIACVPIADAARLAGDALAPNHAIELLVGPEVVTGSTRMKAGTATKLALNMITTCAMVRVGKTWGNLMVDLRASNAKLVDRAARILTQQLSVPRARAIELLDGAGGRVKLALVMGRMRLDAAAAQRLLDAHAGFLTQILGHPR